MKLALMLTLASFSLVGFAAEEEFAKVKTMMLENIDSRITNLQSSRSCVSAATTQDQMKKCREDMKKSHDKMKQDRKAKHEAFKSMKKK